MLRDRTYDQFAGHSSTPSLSSASMGRPTRARWSRLPAPLAECILDQAFRDSDKSVLQWLRLSLVCRFDPCHEMAAVHPVHAMPRRGKT